MGFDHVGLHHQPDLPPIVQEIPCRGAEADRTGSPVGLRSEITRTPCLLMVAGRYPQETPAAHPNVRDDKAVLLSPRHDPARGTGGFQGRRAVPSPPRPGKPNSSSLTRFRGPLRLASKFCLRVGNRTDQHLLKHISFLRVLGDA